MPAYRKLRVWSVKVASTHKDGDVAQYDLNDKREPNAEERASHEFSIGKAFKGRCQYVEATGPWID